jgi:hypothetical protein
LSEGDPYVLDRVMVIDVKVAFGLYIHIDQTVPRELIQHVVEEAYAGRD